MVWVPLPKVKGGGADEFWILIIPEGGLYDILGGGGLYLPWWAWYFFFTHKFLHKNLTFLFPSISIS